MVQRAAMLRRVAAFWARTGVRTMNFGYLAGEAVGFMASGRRCEARAHGMRFAASHWQRLRISASGIRVFCTLLRVVFALKAISQGFEAWFWDWPGRWDFCCFGNTMTKAAGVPACSVDVDEESFAVRQTKGDSVGFWADTRHKLIGG